MNIILTCFPNTYTLIGIRFSILKSNKFFVNKCPECQILIYSRNDYNEFIICYLLL